MFSGDCYHTEIKIYLKQREKTAESITKFYKQSCTCIKSRRTYYTRYSSKSKKHTLK